MKKLSKVIMFCLIAVVMGACNLVPFCPNETTVTNKIVGTWYASLWNSNVCPSNLMEVTVYNADNTGMWCHIEDGVWVETEFTYEVSDRQVTLTFPSGETKVLSISSIGNSTMLCEDVQANIRWNLLKVSHDYTAQLIGNWKRTTEPLNEPNTVNDVYTINADGTYSVVRSATGLTEQGTWNAYGCVLCLSEETFMTRTLVSATNYAWDMSWQTVTDDYQPSACALQRVE